MIAFGDDATMRVIYPPTAQPPPGRQPAATVPPVKEPTVVVQGVAAPPIPFDARSIDHQQTNGLWSAKPPKAPHQQNLADVQSDEEMARILQRQEDAAANNNRSEADIRAERIAERQRKVLESSVKVAQGLFAAARFGAGVVGAAGRGQ